ncbi:MAG: hypothetical protein RLZZ455_1114 [Candidatus Parcubacteria bacterium]
MAGRGSRFQAVAVKNPEFLQPKPLISVRGAPMITWAVRSLPFIDLPQRVSGTSFKVRAQDLIFICLEEHQEKFNIASVLRSLFTDAINVVLIPEVTRGAAETALAGKSYISDGEALVISDTDHYFNGNSYYAAINNKHSDIAGIIPVFKPPDSDPKWSYTLRNKYGHALAVREKDEKLAKKGAYANIGAYFFSRGATFISEAEKMLHQNEMYGADEKKEFYIAPIYQRLLDKGLMIQTVVIEKVWGLGTPGDLSEFLKKYRQE